MMTRHTFPLVMIAVAVLTAGCSNSSTTSPTSPSSLVDSSVASGVTASSANPVVTSQQNTPQPNTSQQPTDSEHRTELHGLVSGLSGGCPDITFTANGTSVVTNGSTRFEDGPCSAVQNGTKVEVKGTKQPDGSVLADKVDIESWNGESEIELEGSASGLGGVCPNITFTVNGTSVVADGSTKFEDGPCSAIQNGTEVEVKGTRQSDGSVLAKKIEIEEVKLKGLVSSLSGVCPNLTFTINGTSVVTNSSTKFEDGHCSTIQNGTEVEVKGFKQPDGSVLASEVETEEVEIEGLVSALAGVCPTLTFSVNGTSVVTNSSTKFEDGHCSSVQNGAKVEVKGTRQPDGSVLARKVEVDEFEIEGSVSGLSGACPNLAFTVHGMPVVTDSSTKFDDGSCSAVQNGTRVEVKGLKQSNGSVLARKVEIEDHD